MEGIRGPYYDGDSGLGQEKGIFVKQYRCFFGSSSATAAALRASCRRIIYDSTHDDSFAYQSQAAVGAMRWRRTGDMVELATY